MATKNGRLLASILSEHVGYTSAIVETCSAICRNGRALDRLNTEECSGPSWIDSATYATPERVRAWQENLDRRYVAARRRLVRAVFDLPATDCGPIGLQLGGDPRGFAVVLVVPTEKGAKGVGIDADGEPCRGAHVDDSAVTA